MNWQPIETAPRDGTIVELRCTYGMEPWTGWFLWRQGWWPGGVGCWVRPEDERSGIDPAFEYALTWRSPRSVHAREAHEQWEHTLESRPWRRAFALVPVRVHGHWVWLRWYWVRMHEDVTERSLAAPSVKD